MALFGLNNDFIRKQKELPIAGISTAENVTPQDRLVTRKRELAKSTPAVKDPVR